MTTKQEWVDALAEKIGALLEPVRVIEFQSGSRYLITVKLSQKISKQEMDIFTQGIKASLAEVLDGVQYQIVVLTGETDMEVYRVKPGEGA